MELTAIASAFAFLTGDWNLPIKFLLYDQRPLVLVAPSHGFFFLLF